MTARPTAGETAAEMILSGIAAIQREADGDGPAAAAIDMGREALALLREHGGIMFQGVTSGRSMGEACRRPTVPRPR